MDEAGLTLGELHAELAHRHRPVLGRTGVSDRLAGRGLMPEFINAVASVCFSDGDVAARNAEAGRAVLAGRPQRNGRPRTAVPAEVSAAEGELRRDLETFRNGGGEADLERIQRLEFENSQLRLGVAQLVRRVDEADRALRAMTRERDEARQQNAAFSRALARLQERGQALAGQTEGEPILPPRLATDGSPEAADESESRSADESGGAGLAPIGNPLGQEQPRGGHPGGEGRLEPADVVADGGANGALQLATMPRSVRRASADAAPAVGLSAAFEAFYTANAAQYRDYAQAQLGSEHVAWELVEETFSYIAMNWQQFLGQERPAAWAWSILRDGVMEHHSRVAAKRTVVTRVLREARTTLEAMDSDFGLYEAISALPERQFEVIMLRYVLGYSDEVTSDLLDMSHSTVRAHSHRARRRLAEALGTRHSLSEPPPTQPSRSPWETREG